MSHNTPQVSLSLDQPVVIAQASPEITGWGPYQFPRIEQLADGSLHTTYHIHADSATAYGLNSGHAISRDQGQSWLPVDDPLSPGGILLPDGDRVLADSLPSLPIKDLTLPKPVSSIHASYVDYDYYDTSTLPPDLQKGWPFQRCRKGTSTWVREFSQVQVKQAANVRLVTENVFVFPFFEQDRVHLAPDGSLRATLYALPHFVGRSRILRPFLTIIVSSRDGGRTWTEIGAIPYHPDPAVDPSWDARDGFSEPVIQDLPDGSLLALLRTDDGNGTGPLYSARSEDGGQTWSRPRVFDDRGVWPQLLTLDCGVILAAYGRPGLFLRATKDPTGHEWNDRITLVAPTGGEPNRPATCSYSDLIALDERHALIVYSDFGHPNVQGKPCKTMLSRRIEIDV